MGRLFWKFFLSIWVAQMIAVLAIGGGIWIKDRNQARRFESIDFGPPAQFVLDAAEVAFRYGGTAALHDLLQNRREQVFALDDQGHDLLGRPVAAATAQSVKELHEQGNHNDAVRRLTAADGSHWLIYVARRSPSPRLRGFDGPRNPPGPPPPLPNDFRPPARGPHFPLTPMLYAMLASLVSALMLAWHFAKPIRHLRSAFDAVASGKLHTRIRPVMGRRRDELSDLGQDFDRMAAQLQTLVDGQRRLLHDVSHELRSPLARLQVAIGLARQRPEKASASLDRIERESVRMDTLIGGLLTLSRMESGVAGNMDEVNIDELLIDVLEDARFEAQAAGKDVFLHDHGAVIVRGNPELLHSAIENVVRNAVHYTPPSSRIDVTMDLQSADKVHITVRDHGPGVPENELEAIFQPFVQSAVSTQANGYGLGLAIAKRVINAHGGYIRASNASGGGLCVDICLPVMAGRSAAVAAHQA